MALELGPAIGAGISTLGMLGPALGVGLIGAKVVESTARQPELAGDLQNKGLIFAALAEALGLLAFLIGLKLAGFF